MTQRVIIDESCAPLSTTYNVDVVETAKSARSSRVWSNLSDCCGAKLKQEKRCSLCSAEVATSEPKFQMTKIGKETVTVSKANREQVQERLDKSQIIKVGGQITYGIAGVGLIPNALESWRYDTKRVLPTEKNKTEYAKLFKYLADGKVLWGEATFRNNTYAVALYRNDQEILLATFTDCDQHYDVKPVGEAAELPVNQAVIDRMNSIAKKRESNPYDVFKRVTAYKDKRNEFEEELISKAINGEPLPDLVQEAVTKQEEDELAALAALDEELKKGGA